MQLFIKNGVVCTIKNGKLKELGFAKKMENVISDVFSVNGGGIYVIQNNKVSLLSHNSSALRIIDGATMNKTAVIQELAEFLKNEDKQNSKVYEAYLTLLQQYSFEEFENLQKAAVVLTSGRDSKLFVKNDQGRYMRDKDVISLDFDESPSFIYHGALYARNAYAQYEHLPLNVLFAARQYMLLWGGGENVFVLQATKKGSKIIKLGALKQLFETAHGIVIEVDLEWECRYGLYFLGDSLELIFERADDEDFDIDPETGGIAHYKNGFAQGYKVGQTDYYVFKKKHYAKLDLK